MVKKIYKANKFKNIIEYAKKKLLAKNLDLIIANNVAKKNQVLIRIKIFRSQAFFVPSSCLGTN